MLEAQTLVWKNLAYYAGSWIFSRSFSPYIIGDKELLSDYHYTTTLSTTIFMCMHTAHTQNGKNNPRFFTPILSIS